MSTAGLEVAVTDGKGVSRYVGGAGGEIYAYRTGGDVALETVTIDRGVTADSVRLVDGSGTTTVDGNDLDGTTFTLQRSAAGVETASVTSTGGAYNADAVTPAAFAAIDAFGDTVSVKGGAQGALAISLTDEFGDTFGFSGGVDGSQASLTAAVTVGGYSQTVKAEVVAQDEATLTTGSIARAATALEADGTSGKADGTLDVLGGAQGSILDGAQTDQGDLIDGRASQAGEGAEMLDGGAPRTIVNLNVQAQGEDVRNITQPKTSSTNDDGEISLTAFGHETDTFTSEEIDRVDDHVYVTNLPGSLMFVPELNPTQS